MAAIFQASASPSAAVPGRGWDKLLHFLAYGLLAVLMLRALADGDPGRAGWRRTTVAAILAILYGLTDEWHQSFVPGRLAEGADVVADAAGALAGVWGARAWGIIGTRHRMRSRDVSRG